MIKQTQNSISLDSIAAECGVSPMTVSRALRQLPTVSEETRKRIFEVAARLGYLRTTRAGRKATAITKSSRECLRPRGKRMWKPA